MQISGPLSEKLREAVFGQDATTAKEKSAALACKG